LHLAVLALAVTPAYADDVTSTYGVRPATQCPEVTQPPNLSQVVLLLACRDDHDIDGSDHVGRVSRISVRLGAPREAQYGDPNDDDVDTSVDVYPIRGSKTESTCSAITDYMQNQGSNCTETDFSGNGICYQTSFGDWKCILTGSLVASRGQMPPPR
jgi:hypothetical protein